MSAALRRQGSFLYFIGKRRDIGDIALFAQKLSIFFDIWSFHLNADAKLHDSHVLSDGTNAREAVNAP